MRSFDLFLRSKALRHLLSLSMMLHAGFALAHGDAVCTPTAEITAARNASERDPDAIAVRRNLADALAQAGCYDEAMHELEAALQRDPRNAELQKRLRTVRSNIDERQFFDGLDQAQAEARLSRNLLRCKQLADVTACDEAQRLRPDDAQIAIAKGDALLKADRAAEAFVTYRRASTLAPGNAEALEKLRAAQSQRQLLSQQCTRDNQTSLEPCENALLVGEADEFAIRQRVAVIHQSNNRLSEALDAYIAARALRRGDEAVAQAIVALVDSSGRKDAGALAARGTSLLTLGRAADALSALRQAQTLAPGFPEIAAAIATAERQVRMDEQMESRRRAATVVEQAPPPNTAAQITAVPERRYSNAATASRSH